ncbi:MAG: hypothetical protein U0525_02280 [Patescibacteria group bacterium]
MGERKKLSPWDSARREFRLTPTYGQPDEWIRMAALKKIYQLLSNHEDQDEVSLYAALLLPESPENSESFAALARQFEKSLTKSAYNWEELISIDMLRMHPEVPLHMKMGHYGFSLPGVEYKHRGVDDMSLKPKPCGDFVDLKYVSIGGKDYGVQFACDGITVPGGANDSMTAQEISKIFDDGFDLRSDRYNSTLPAQYIHKLHEELRKRGKYGATAACTMVPLDNREVAYSAIAGDCSAYAIYFKDGPEDMRVFSTPRGNNDKFDNVTAGATHAANSTNLSPSARKYWAKDASDFVHTTGFDPNNANSNTTKINRSEFGVGVIGADGDLAKNINIYSFPPAAEGESRIIVTCSDGLDAIAKCLKIPPWMLALMNLEEVVNYNTIRGPRKDRSVTPYGKGLIKARSIRSIGGPNMLPLDSTTVGNLILALSKYLTGEIPSDMEERGKHDDVGAVISGIFDPSKLKDIVNYGSTLNEFRRLVEAVPVFKNEGRKRHHRGIQIAGQLHQFRS